MRKFRWFMISAAVAAGCVMMSVKPTSRSALAEQGISSAPATRHAPTSATATAPTTSQPTSGRAAHYFPPTAMPLRPSKERVARIRAGLVPLHAKLGKPGQGDWLDRHPDEPGQTLEEYLSCSPVVPTATRRTIYIQPLGKFTATQRKIVQLASEMLGRFYDLPVKLAKDMDESVVPASARRTRQDTGDKQLLTTHILDDLLQPALPADAFACIAFTAQDLWPGEGWNFVFGQASLHERVGVWSLYRFGDPDKGVDAFVTCLRRTLKTATHELGHMFSIQHCKAYECGMCGSNSLGEADRRPMAFCPECMAKVFWATGANPAARFARLAEFCRAQGLTAEAEYFEKAREVVAK